LVRIHGQDVRMIGDLMLLTVFLILGVLWLALFSES
jgi:hypothetical protein